MCVCVCVCVIPKSDRKYLTRFHVTGFQDIFLLKRVGPNDTSFIKRPIESIKRNNIKNKTLTIYSIFLVCRALLCISLGNFVGIFILPGLCGTG